MAEEVRSIKDLRAAYYANTHAIDKRCQKHPTVLMIRTKNPCTGNVSEFCPECGQELINRDIAKAGAEAEAQIRNFKSYAVFERESIVSPKIANATIGNYEIQTEQDAEAVNFVKRFATDYFKGRYEGNVVLQAPPVDEKLH